MACQACYPTTDTTTDDDKGTDDEAMHPAPERPTGLPDCADGTTPDPDDCDPTEEINRRKRELEGAQADVENRNRALEELKAKSVLLDQAWTTYQEQATAREDARKACEEFVDCKRPNLPADECDCVEQAIGDYATALDEYEAYIRHCLWKIGKAGIRTARAERRHQRAEAHYEAVRAEASGCLAGCAELRAAYDTAVEAEEWCGAYLYWRLAQRMLAEATDDCLDPDGYRDHLCRAFERLCNAADNLNYAKAAQDELEREKAAVVAEYDALKADEVGTLAAQVAKCCCQDEPADTATPTDRPATEGTAPAAT